VNAFFFFRSFLLSLLILLQLSTGVHGFQQLPGIDPTLRSGDQREPLFEQDEEPMTAPEIKSPSFNKHGKEQKTDAPIRANDIRIFVKKVDITGNKIFSDQELSVVSVPYLNRDLGYLDLEKLRRDLTHFYINQGFVNSGAILPDQIVSDGTVIFHIVEGELTEVSISGNKWLRDGYYKSRIRLSSGPPVNIFELEDRLQLLQQKDVVKRLHAEFKPGLTPGQSILDLRVEENSPFSAFVAFNNYQSPSVGAERGLLSLSHKSVTGIGDRLDITYGRSEGLDPLFDASYQIPFTSWDTTFQVRYRKNAFDIVEEAFDDLDISSESQIIELKLTQPLFYSENQVFAVGVIGERLTSKSWLEGEAFSFSPGSQNGESTVAAIRFFQTYLYRSKKQAFSLHSRFSWGIDAFDAVINEDGQPDGDFFAWLGQVQWTGIFSSFHIQPVFRLDVQLADDALLSLEQLPVGGRYSVRGYRENQLVRDNGVIASIETRIPLIRNLGWTKHLQLIPFFDFGRAWYKETSAASPDKIYSIGVGLKWSFSITVNPFPIDGSVEIFWGHQLEKVDKTGNTLQDDGIHFQVAISAF
jgi:hemolysin activation/secretion protein